MVLPAKDDVHVSFTQIREFEMRCQGELNFEFDEERNTSKIQWEALLLPGFTPRISDIFLYELRNGKIAVFRVTSITRLAMGQDSYFKINCDAQEYLTSATKNRLQKQSTIVCYFDKAKFIVGNHAMLTTNSYIQQKDLKYIRNEIIQNYMDRFFSSELSSFVRPDGLYDPYAVEFWNKKVSFLDCPTRPVQILIAVQNYKKTIWAALTNNPIKQIKNLASDWKVSMFVSTFWGANITSLLGRKFITVGDEDASKLGPMMDRFGNTHLVDAVPYAHTHAFDKLIYEHAERMFDLVFEKLKKHHHDCSDYHLYTTGEDHDDCKHECHHDKHHHRHHDKYHHDKCHDHHHHLYDPTKYFKPPYPIVSTEELFVIWKVLNNISNEQILTEEHMSEFRGYVRWYRYTYSGTFSRTELEYIWRKKVHLRPDQLLKDSEKDNLIKFIQEYRSKFPRVFTDSEIEYIWRLKHCIEPNRDLTEDEHQRLQIAIHHYRQLHGYPPNDGFEVMPISELGELPSIDDIDPGFNANDNIDPGFSVTPIDPEFGTSVDPGFNHPMSTISIIFKRPKKHHCHHDCDSDHDHYCDDHHCHEPILPPVQKTYYALSKEFYAGSTVMDPFEMLVHNSLTNKDIDPEKILEGVSRYLEWNDEDAFYRHLFALYLIDRALFYIKFSS